MAELLEVTDSGLYCPAGNFYIDPWAPVERALITHAHSDHARWGSKEYLCQERGEHLLRIRLGEEAKISTTPWNDVTVLDGVRVSFHPAGHILGSAQIRVEYKGEIWVASGDYKVEADGTCDPFEPIRCHTFITESTFALPIYRWPEQRTVFEAINSWWLANQQQGRTSVIFAYSLGKAQRVLSGLNPSIGPIVVHGAVLPLCRVYQEQGVALPPVLTPAQNERAVLRGKALIIAPPSAMNTPWIRSFAPLSTSFASGWMQTRGARRRRGVDKGFLLSDHADWPALLAAIDATQAESVITTHGYTDVLVRWLLEQGKAAREAKTRFGEHLEGEMEEA